MKIKILEFLRDTYKFLVALVYIQRENGESFERSAIVDQCVVSTRRGRG